MYQVFVSSTYEDLKEERNEVIKALIELGCFPAGMEYFPASDEDQWTYIKKLIATCDYYIVIIAGRYGSELPSGMSYTEREYRFALENEIPVIAFTHNNIQKISGDKLELEPDKRRKLELFLELVKMKLCRTWRDKYELGSVVSRSLTTLKENNPRVGWIRGDSKTEEHANLIIENNCLENKYQKLKSSQLTAPTYYKDFEHTLPSIEGIVNDLMKDKFNQMEPIKIRILGVCFHKSFNFLKDFIEKNSASGKRIEIRLSALDRKSEIMGVLNNVWASYFDIYEQQLDALIKNLTKIENANVSLKISKYSHMPNWHGILINKTDLFLSTCLWNSDKSMTAGENHYAYYKKGTSWLHDRKILQFKRWFDYGRFNGSVKKEAQVIIDTMK